MANMYPSKMASGGAPTETVLWTNPSPSSEFESSINNAYLDKTSIDEADLIKIAYRSVNTSSTEFTVYLPPTQLQMYSYRMPLYLNPDYVHRQFTFQNNNSSTYKLYVGYCTKPGDSTRYSQYLIPTEISAIKY